MLWTLGKQNSRVLQRAGCYYIAAEPRTFGNGYQAGHTQSERRVKVNNKDLFYQPWNYFHASTEWYFYKYFVLLCQQKNLDDIPPARKKVQATWDISMASWFQRNNLGGLTVLVSSKKFHSYGFSKKKFSGSLYKINVTQKLQWLYKSLETLPKVCSLARMHKSKIIKSDG